MLRLSNRLKKMEKALHQSDLTQPYYRCLVDGEECFLSELDIRFAEILEGKHVEKLGFAGNRPIPFNPNDEPLEVIMDRICAEYNSPENVAKREAEYKELLRIGELRRQDFYAGRPMDTHPLPWEKGKV